MFIIKIKDVRYLDINKIKKIMFRKKKICYNKDYLKDLWNIQKVRQYCIYNIQ